MGFLEDLFRSGPGAAQQKQQLGTDEFWRYYQQVMMAGQVPHVPETPHPRKHVESRVIENITGEKTE